MPLRMQQNHSLVFRFVGNYFLKDFSQGEAVVFPTKAVYKQISLNCFNLWNNYALAIV